jgi:hypothetical protein
MEPAVDYRGAALAVGQIVTYHDPEDYHPT